MFFILSSISISSISAEGNIEEEISCSGSVSIVGVSFEVNDSEETVNLDPVSIPAEKKSNSGSDGSMKNTSVPFVLFFIIFIISLGFTFKKN